MRPRRRLVCVVGAMVFLGACSTPGAWSDPQGVQLSLGGDRICSDPVFGQVAMQCCMPHDNAFWVGGCEQDFHLANAEFLACMLLWQVPPAIAYARWAAVDSKVGWRSWNLRSHCTRGPPR